MSSQPQTHAFAFALYLTPRNTFCLRVYFYSIVKTVEASRDPFTADSHKDNPWVISNPAGGGCCSVQ